MPTTEKNKPQPVIFGEALFDQFEERSVAGGAPFNVAWHLNGLRAYPLFLSRVGDDEEGRHLKQLSEKWGLNTSCLQIDPTKETGKVLVKNDPDTGPAYEIKDDQAYDAISYEQIAPHLNLPANTLLYHGSLALRHETCRETLQKIREQLGFQCTVFFDLNLRPPWVEQDVILHRLKEAHWLKCNADELKEIAHWQGWEASDENLTFLTHTAIETFQLKGAVITLGADGSFAIDADGNTAKAPQPEIHHLQDTVGAGDSFSAMFIYGILKNWPLEKCLSHAATLASRICTVEGGTSFNPEFYEDLQE